MKELLKSTWDFLSRLEIQGSKFNREIPSEEIDSILDDFAYSLANICNCIIKENKKDGIVFIIDEVDNASDSLNIGLFFKIVTESLQQYECGNVMFIVVGLPEVSEKLTKSHASSLRIFQNVNIKFLNDEDRHYIIDKCIEECNVLNEEVKISITKEAKETISFLSQGYPHFIQQFGHSAFEHNSDGEISYDDVNQSLIKEGGAIDELGKRYYASAFYSKIQSNEYRQVLQIMAEHWDEWIDKKTIKDGFTGTPNILTNALTALTHRKIILRNPSVQGQYKLLEIAFAIWIK
jgi:hypothetical protein